MHNNKKRQKPLQKAHQRNTTLYQKLTAQDLLLAQKEVLLQDYERSKDLDIIYKKKLKTHKDREKSYVEKLQERVMGLRNDIKEV